CEEDVSTARDPSRLFEQDHGWVFEVKPTARPALARPEPIRPMGRFYHEAVAVDPASGIVYMTEDRGDGLIYRYVPKERERLLAGGRLQAMAARAFRQSGLDTRNWGDRGRIPIGRAHEAEWIDLDEILAPKDDLRERGAAKGAAVFARGEGMWYGGSPGAIYWACTEGGREKLGQIWRYTPSPHEGTDDERSSPGRFELFIEPDDARVLRNADNITFAPPPRGDIIVCEDCDGENRLLGVTPGGEVYTLARNAKDRSEFAGATFSPDGSTLFVNIQEPGSTLAVRGPWRG
ncbi:MAG: PhoX family protein, partial [Candidatus Rokubacteria bacterium]|nr:PhoX family protein [Candidatus Rokubacteria bacterium]